MAAAVHLWFMQTQNWCLWPGDISWRLESVIIGLMGTRTMFHITSCSQLFTDNPCLSIASLFQTTTIHCPFNQWIFLHLLSINFLCQLTFIVNWLYFSSCDIGDFLSCWQVETLKNLVHATLHERIANDDDLRSNVSGLCTGCKLNFKMTMCDGDLTFYRQ